MGFRHPRGFSAFADGWKARRDGDMNSPACGISPAGLTQEHIMYKTEKSVWGPETLSAYCQFAPGLTLLAAISETLS